MKYYLFTVLLLTLGCTSNKILVDNTDMYQIIHLPQYYQEVGVIFSKKYEAGILMYNVRERYNPSFNDIQKAESILMEKFNGIRNTNYDVKKHFTKYVRQYIGVINNSGERNIIIQLINNSKKGKVRRLLGKSWETDFEIQMSDKYYRISERLRINLDTGVIIFSL